MTERDAAKEDTHPATPGMPAAGEPAECPRARELPYDGRTVRLIFDGDGPSLRDALLDYFASLQ